MNKPLPTYQIQLDTEQLERAVKLANELIEKINAVKTTAREFNDIVNNIDLNFGITGKSEDF